MKLNTQTISHTVAVVILLLLVCALPTMNAMASTTDQQRATQAVETGEILSLRVILERLEPSHPGQVLDVEFEQKKGVWIYELKILKAGGRLQKLKIDAKTGEIISNKER